MKERISPDPPVTNPGLLGDWIRVLASFEADVERHYNFLIRYL